MPLARLSRIFDVRDTEVRACVLAFLYFFLLLAGYYVLRPLREEMGLAGGVRNLPWLFQATLLATLVVTPLFGWCVQRFQRSVMMKVTYRFFIAQLLIFFVLAQVIDGRAEIWMGRVFYVWLSVFNMFVVSVFWAFLADGFSLEQSKRVFGVIAAGGSLGAIAGAGLTSVLVEPIGRVPLLLVAAVLLESAVWVIAALHREFESMRARESKSDVQAVAEEREAERRAWTGPLHGALNGIGLTFRSRYLLAISLFLALYSLCSTFLYFEQADIVARTFDDRAARTAMFARIDLWVNLLTLSIQVFLSGRIIKRIGVGPTLVVLPVLSVIGFAALAFAPILGVLVVFQVLRRASNYALVRPARETLFTMVNREERYKAKSFVDTFVYRGGDSIGSLAFDGLTRLGLTLGPIAIVAALVAALWGGVGAWLGRKQSALADKREREFVLSLKT